MEHLHEVACGTYQPCLARQYTTSLVNQAANARGPANQNLQQFHAARSQAPVNQYCFFFDQVAAPGNWPAGQQWHPVRILVSRFISAVIWETGKGVLNLISLQIIQTDYPKVVPNIPSRYTAAKKHTAVLAYVPVGVPEESESPALPPWHLLPPPPGQSYSSSPEVQRVKGWICGPRSNNTCVPGARTTVYHISSFLSND